MRIVERRVPVTETRPEKSRRSIYRIRDPFLRFWFRFVHPFQDRLDLVGWNENARDLLVAEVNWTEQPVGVNVLDALRAKVPLIPGGPWKRVVPVLFAKSGFTPTLRARQAREEMILVSASDVLGALEQG